jgi:hypothetical protein
MQEDGCRMQGGESVGLGRFRSVRKRWRVESRSVQARKRGILHGGGVV